jgi:membrane-bound serine protease (ClpP class)
MEWVAVFLVGILLLILELFVFPGTVVLGVAGAGLILTSLVMAMVDIYPGTPALPQITMPQSNLGPAVTNLAIAMGGALVLAAILARFLPKTKLYNSMVSTTASGVVSVAMQEQKQTARVGQTGVAISLLRPGGKAKFGDELLDVMTQGEMIEKGQRVRIIGHSAAEAVVEAVG